MIRTVDGNTMNKQLRTATSRGLPALVLDDVLTTPHQNANVLQNIMEASGLNRSFWGGLSQGWVTSTQGGSHNSLRTHPEGRTCVIHRKGDGDTEFTM